MPIGRYYIKGKLVSEEEFELFGIIDEDEKMKEYEQSKLEIE